MKNIWVGIVFILMIQMCLMSCIGTPDFPKEPVIEFMGLSKYEMTQNSFNTDSVLIQFSFTDGDGDLGSSEQDNQPDITVIDTRTGEEEAFEIPEIQNGQTKFAISGDLTLKLYTTCCLFPKNIPPCTSPKDYPRDSIVYEIFITDAAGNESNHIQTPPIVLLCN